MGRRRFEMFQYRHVLVRLRAGDSVREIARARLMGRDKLAELRAVAEQQGWLDGNTSLPEDEVIAAAVGGGQARALHRLQLRALPLAGEALVRRRRARPCGPRRP